MRRHAPVGVALLATLSLLLAACGGAADEGSGGTGGALGEYDLSGIDIAVGSKDFDEQLILGYVLVHTFQAAGANVEDRVDLGGTNVARAALESGEIDTYAEYNGTGWAVHLGREDPSFDPEELTENVREADREENGIVWLGRTPFNNTYAFATGPELTEEHGGAFTMQEMADYLAENPDATVCMESEFPSRDDGLVLFEEHTGYEVPESQIQILDTGVIYTETAEGACDFGEVFTTDGRIPALDLAVVEDPGVMILYNVSVTMREEVYEQAPEAFDEIADLILEPLTNERMAELNARVSAEGEDPEDVARDYLQEEGLIA